VTTSTIDRFSAFKELLKFSLPIIIGQIGLMLIGTGDMIIAGRYSRECLAAIGLAISIANPIQISLLGLQFSISPLLAQKRGNGESLGPYFWTVFTYSFLIALVSSVLTYFSFKLVPLFGYDDKLESIIQEYLIITSFSSFGLCFYQGMKEFFQSMEKTLAANSLALVAVVVNLICNYAFVFGEFGMPQLKEAGLAWASLLVRTFMGIGLMLMAYRWWRRPFKIDWSFMKELWKIGGPISVSLFFEIMAFCSVTLFVGKFPDIQTAANNLALNIGSLAFMVPLSVSAAVGVKVGHAYGERNKDSILIYSEVSLFTSFIFTLCMGSIFYFFPHAVMSLYTDDVLVLDWAKKLLFWVACFQLFDGAQVTIAGILRGLSITRAASLSIFFGYWVIGIPLGYYLGFYSGLEAQGFWIGLATSLAVVAVMLGTILRKKLVTLSFAMASTPDDK
jgi:multidrug resistance protein, MATE family